LLLVSGGQFLAEILVSFERKKQRGKYAIGKKTIPKV
jgi:hypothetical protein